MSSSGGSMPERRQRRRTEQSSETEAGAAAVSTAMVLGNRDLLAGILFRVDSPTWLVRAALVSKNWLRIVSDPAFLDRFRALHPPRVLGLSVVNIGSRPRLLPVTHSPELAAAARLTGHALGNLGRKCGRVIDYCNGRILVELRDSRYSLNRAYAVASLLHEAREKIILPPAPPLGGAASGPNLFLEGNSMFLLEDNGDDMSCLFLSLACNMTTVCADFSILRFSVWGVPQSAVRELEQQPYFTVFGHKLLSGRKLYMMTTAGCILVLDLATATLSAVDLPDGGEHSACVKFSRAKQSGLYLICAIGFQLRIWHGDGAGQWVLVDIISVCEACAQLNVQTWVPDDETISPVWIVGAADSAEFVILELVASRIICCMQLGNRVVEKVAEGGQQNYVSDVCPITMVWPPFLPVPPVLE